MAQKRRNHTPHETSRRDEQSRRDRKEVAIGNQQPSSPKFTGKEVAGLIVATCLALASLRPSDAVVILPMLALSGLAFLYICFRHPGRVWVRSSVGAGIVLVLGGIGFRAMTAANAEPPVTKADIKELEKHFPDGRGPVVPNSNPALPPNSDRKAPVSTPSAVRKELSGTNRAEFIRALQRVKGNKDTVSISCARYSEPACARAMTFLMAFSEAGWPLKAATVDRVEVATPYSGVTVISHSDNPPPPAPHMGWWTKMDENDTALYFAFQQLGMPPHAVGTKDVPKGERVIYFGPEVER
jgi:hypothetical protein